MHFAVRKLKQMLAQSNQLKDTPQWSLIAWFIRSKLISFVISASKGNCEAVSRTAERFGVQTHYYRLPMWPVMCVTKNVMVKQTLVWFGAYPEKKTKKKTTKKKTTKTFHDLAETIDKAAVPIIAIKEPITPSIPIARGWITRLMTSAYKTLRSQPFWILSPLRILFLFILRLFTS